MAKGPKLDLITVRLYRSDLEFLRERFPLGRRSGARRGPRGECGYNEWLRELVHWAIERERWAQAAPRGGGSDGNDEDMEDWGGQNDG